MPTTKEEVLVWTPYPYFSVFLFDFKANTQIIWGEDFKRKLPKAPDPATIAESWLRESLQRFRIIKNAPKDRQRAAYAAYKIILVAQLYYGERTLEKTRILKLYLDNVPEFPQKVVGEHIIRGYLGAIYPHRPAEDMDTDGYRGFVRGVLDLIHKTNRE